MLAIYGPGGLGRELVAIATFNGRKACFLSDNDLEIGRSLHDVPIHSLEQVSRLPNIEEFVAVVAVADSAVRRKLAGKLAAAGLMEGFLVAQNSVVGPGVTMGAGAILSHFVAITASIRIGRHFQASHYACVAHDCDVGDFVTLGPRACVNGNTVIEDDVYIGAGAVLKQGTPDKPLRIGKGAFIGMGAVVTKDVAAGAIVVGNPARPLKRNE